MFQPPQASEAEIRQGEYEANQNINTFIGTAVLLYLSPFLVDSVLGFF